MKTEQWGKAYEYMKTAGKLFPNMEAAKAPPTLACRKKFRIKKIPRFSFSETVFCAGIDSKNNLKHILKRLFRVVGG